ncbi:MAG TPA: hypothetical protein VNZ44_12360 [Pyrinomonadaceae bacterium]|nr:hypothetical protein [Pyrinomonadaceae bacterium]
MNIRKNLALASALGVALAAVGLAVASAASNSINFEPPTYVVGSPNGQDGWVATGSAGAGCAPYDHKITSTSTFTGIPASFGSQSLRVSNAVTSGCFGDQTFSKPVADEAGEPTALNGGMSGGTRQPAYTGEWTFISTTPNAEQPGLSVVVSPDRGDGARMSWILMADTPAGVDVNFYDYRDNAPYGSAGNESAGCDAEDDFFFTPVATGLARNVPHTVKVVMQFVPGPRNDVVQVYVDGVLKHTGTSWEDYFRWCEATDQSRTVDSLLFRTGGDPAPGTFGYGFLFDAVGQTSGTAPTNKDQCKGNGWASFNVPRAFKNQGDCIQYFNTGK